MWNLNVQLRTTKRFKVELEEAKKEPICPKLNLELVEKEEESKLVKKWKSTENENKNCVYAILVTTRREEGKAGENTEQSRETELRTSEIERIHDARDGAKIYHVNVNTRRISLRIATVERLN